MDAIRTVRTLSESAVRSGGGGVGNYQRFGHPPLAKSNRATLEYHEYHYPRAITKAYLLDRTVKFIDQNGMANRMDVSCRVPQGSVLGSLLWNLAYDAVLALVCPLA